MAFVNLIDSVSDLLFKHNCVIIPGFGGFIANFKPSGFEESRNLISPSSKKVAFNQSLLENDGLLVNAWAQSQNLSYQDALNDIANFASFLKQKINTNKSFDFKTIGTFYLNAENKIIFVPYQGLNFLDSSFGLFPVKIKPVHYFALPFNSPSIQGITKTETIALEPTKTIPFAAPRTDKYKIFPQVLKVASVLLFVAVSVFSVVYLIDSNRKTLLVNSGTNENQASILRLDTNTKKSKKTKSISIARLEYQKERQKIKDIKTKLDAFAEYNSPKQDTYNVVVGYYNSLTTAQKNYQILKNEYSNAVLSDKTAEGYGIVVETFFKHTTAETFCVMLKQFGFKNVKIEKQIVIGK